MRVERKESGKGHSRKNRTTRTPSASKPQLRIEEAPKPQRAGVSYVTVETAYDGQRLDNFLIRLAKGVPKSHIYRIVRSGEVRINQARAAADQRLAAGDRIRIPPLRTSASRPVAPGSLLMPPVVYEDDHLLVVDKPSGVAAHGGSGISHGVIERVRAARPAQVFLELAHRLDRDTSGLLILAKTRPALVRLHEMLRQGEVDKRYLALVSGAWVNQRQHVRLGLSRITGGPVKVRVDEVEGASAHTIFELRERFGATGPGFALLEAELRTGRTHQIRVHLAHLGFPIVGDDKYGNFELNHRLARDRPGAAAVRMFLHAWRIRLLHPVGGAPVELQSPLPGDCQALLEALRRA